MSWIFKELSWQYDVVMHRYPNVRNSLLKVLGVGGALAVLCCES